MKLLPNTIYKAYNFTSGTPLPSLYVKGTAQIFVSFDTLQPKSIEEMHEVTSEVSEGTNLLQGQIRWIAVKYTDDGSAVVEEAGIVTSSVSRGL